MSRWKFGGLAGLVVLGASGPALAEDAPAGRTVTSVEAIAAPEGLRVAPIGDTELGAISGGQGVVVEALSNQQLSASNSGSVAADQVATGNVDFSTGDYSGIGNFVVNTGNNNNLQGVISVNIATLGGS
ncbi:hypothetical protein [Phenylobacterium sp. 58.2.17]|uniref:hypothetical protein n=1 Tax=Phenylobacterium sp. 58.2.17 TaxID=2969306 RepID=UPI0022648173|nr:hypothetical protein [Phenylobacterium sp. 58.2.17]MCX7587899.1 hypothetical protein [Phenylobacterium sp. 58.2.17]